MSLCKSIEPKILNLTAWLKKVTYVGHSPVEFVYLMFCLNFSFQVFSPSHQGDGSPLHGREFSRSSFSWCRRLRRWLVRNFCHRLPSSLKPHQGSTWLPDLSFTSSPTPSFKICHFSIADSRGAFKGSSLSLRSTFASIRNASGRKSSLGFRQKIGSGKSTPSNYIDEVKNCNVI